MTALKEQPEKTETEKVEEEETQILDLTALTPTRRLVKLPTKKNPVGERFELRTLDDFGIELQQQLMAWTRRYEQLMRSDEDLSASQKERLRFLLDSIFDTILDAPKPVKNGMTDAVRNRVVTTFSVGPLLERQEAQMAIIQRLMKKEYVTQEQVDEAMDEIRAEVVSQSISES